MGRPIVAIEAHRWLDLPKLRWVETRATCPCFIMFNFFFVMHSKADNLNVDNRITNFIIHHGKKLNVMK